MGVADLWLLARSAPGVDVELIRRLREPTGLGPEWDEVLAQTDASAQELVIALARADARVPEVGVDLPDARGRASDVVGELVWAAEKVAIVTRAVSVSRVEPGWAIFSVSEAMADLARVIAELAREGSA